ncbi:MULTISPECIES: hypothetical protein [Nocardiaceae]|uniref:hypothetical protein n=1 Tax=Nocardiaceae TaxID=85025 RepID=UPI00056B8DDE|nr:MULTISPECIES: hypothetical protein [Rhodococcus]OZE99478.1 hypothetical protein CH301_15115 [Rhodococcus sp. 15-1189-1-1a]OZF13768.1 hypothetical protein CH299_14895 [Rhodococcus sp. 14-2686-1-2]OZF50905.1 hypothetical protein CH293_15425 [Rhodococcus sp. 14-2470-1b]
MGRSRFHGEIFGVGTSSGVRIVVGHWTRSPLGEFTDVMIQFSGGHRLLLAPDDNVREFVTATYTFDDVSLTPVVFTRVGDTVTVNTDALRLTLRTGRSTALGALLAVVPSSISTAPWFCRISDPIARVVLRGVRTRGSAGNDRREYYGAKHQHRIIGASASWRGDDLGHLTPVTPPVTFGFGSTPAAPSVTSITTTIDTP